MNNIRYFAVLFILGAAVLACASPLEVLPTAAPANVETIVALTLQALTPVTPSSPTALPDADGTPAAPSLLPYSLYFLNNDGAGLLQVFRLAADGAILTQLTFEPAAVDGYDVSPADGSVAYTSNNQLFLINADGSGRRLLIDGGPQDANSPYLNDLHSPVWSPNGQTIAYGLGGLNFYAVSSGISNRVLENQIDNSNPDLPFPRELYWPTHYSPDGSKLMVTLGYYEGISFGIYYPSGDALVYLSGADDIVFGSTNWTSDSTHLYTARASLGMFGPGLWQVNAATGAVATLLSGASLPDGSYNFPDAPFLGPDGQLYYFFVNLHPGDEFINHPPLQLVRSALDGVTGRTVLRPETFNLLNEALWAPDASFVIAANAPTDTVFQGGQAILFYTDGRPPVVLAPYAYEMKWGP
jgi:hypothetical protein